MTTRRTRSYATRPPPSDADQAAATSKVVADPAQKLALEALVEALDGLFKPLRKTTKDFKRENCVPVQDLAALAMRDWQGSKAGWTASEKRAFALLEGLGKADEATWSMLWTYSSGGSKVQLGTSFCNARRCVYRKLATAATLLKDQEKATANAESKRRADAELTRPEAQKKAKVAADATPATLVGHHSLAREIPVAPIGVMPSRSVMIERLFDSPGSPMPLAPHQNQRVTAQRLPAPVEPETLGAPTELQRSPPLTYERMMASIDREYGKPLAPMGLRLIQPVSTQWPAPFERPPPFAVMQHNQSLNTEQLPLLENGMPITMQRDPVAMNQLLDSLDFDLPFESEVGQDVTIEPFLTSEPSVKEEVFAAILAGPRNGRNNAGGL